MCNYAGAHVYMGARGQPQVLLLNTLHLFKRQDLSLAWLTYKAQLLASSPRTCIPSSSQGQHYKHAQPWLLNVSSRD